MNCSEVTTASVACAGQAKNCYDLFSKKVPTQLIYCALSYLDFKSVSNCEKVNRTYRKLTSKEELVRSEAAVLGVLKVPALLKCPLEILNDPYTPLAETCSSPHNVPKDKFLRIAPHSFALQEYIPVGNPYLRKYHSKMHLIKRSNAVSTIPDTKRVSTFGNLAFVTFVSSPTVATFNLDTCQRIDNCDLKENAEGYGLKGLSRILLPIDNGRYLARTATKLFLSNDQGDALMAYTIHSDKSIGKEPLWSAKIPRKFTILSLNERWLLIRITDSYIFPEHLILDARTGKALHEKDYHISEGLLKGDLFFEISKNGSTFTVNMTHLPSRVKLPSIVIEKMDGISDIEVHDNALYILAYKLAAPEAIWPAIPRPPKTVHIFRKAFQPDSMFKLY